MAFTTVSEDYGSRHAEDNEVRTASRRFIVVSNSRSDSATGARQATGVPRRGDPHPEDAVMVCVNIDASQTAPFVFEVNCEYSTRGFGPGDENDHPLDKPAVREYGFISSIEPAYTDRDGNAILTSARVEFDPTLERPVYDPYVIVTRNQATFSASTALNFIGHVNSASWTVPGTNDTVTAGQALCTNIAGSEAWYEGQRYYEVRYEFHLREDGFAKRVVDRGMMKLAASGSALCYEVITDDNGNPVSEPVLLDGSGGVLACGGTPVYLTYDVFPEANFNSLNLT